MLTVYGSEARWISLGLIVIALVCWGMWPTMREFNGYPMPSFALVNVLSQFCTALVFCATMGFVVTPGNSATVYDDIVDAFVHPRTDEGLAMDPESKSAVRLAMAYEYIAIVAGGFLLGHGDHLGALAMQYISGGVALAIYGGLCMVLGTALNIVQVGASEHPVLLVIGLVLVLAGVGSLAAAQSLLDKLKAQRAKAASNEKMLRESLHSTDKFDEASEEEVKGVGTTGAIIICIIAAVCAGAWSPLSTYARAAHELRCCNQTNATQMSANTSLQADGFLVALLFVIGEILALPSIICLGSRISGMSCRESFRATSLYNIDGTFSQTQFRKLGFGILCGVMVNTGYQVYFIASAHINPAVVFALVACNPLLAMAADATRCKFRGASVGIAVLLVMSVLMYGSALAILSQTH